jgi:uncharacterized membrane protein
LRVGSALILICTFAPAKFRVALAHRFCVPQPAANWHEVAGMPTYDALFLFRPVTQMTTCPFNLVFGLLDRFLLQQIGQAETAALVRVYGVIVVQTRTQDRTFISGE